MRILNLYAGLGGNRGSWDNHEVTSVEFNPKIADMYCKRFPNDEVVIQDVFTFLRDKNNNLDDYQFIWASPPCQSHSQLQMFNPSKDTRSPIPDTTSIYGLFTWLNYNFSHSYVIENVQPYYVPHQKQTVKLGRHLFWANFPIKPKNFNQKFLETIRGDNPGSFSEEEYQFHVKRLKLSIISDDLKKEFKGKKLRTVIRNCIDPRVGKYILAHINQKPGLMNYL